MYSTNKKVINKMKELIKSNMCTSDIKRYYEKFPYELDYNVFQYGNLDCYDYDLYLRLKDFGVTTKAVKEYEKILNGGCTYKHREQIRNTYKIIVRKAVQELVRDYNE